MQPARIAGEDPGETVRSDSEGPRTEVSQLGFRLLRPEQPHACSLLRARLREDQPRSALEFESERGRLRPLLPCAQKPKPPCCHQVHEQDESSVIGRKEQALAAAFNPREAAPFEVAKRRVEGLE